MQVIELSAHDRAAIAEIVADMEAGWNRASARDFCAHFDSNPDFVTVRGEYYKDGADIVAGHDAIFRSIYEGSVNRYDLIAARALSEDVALVHVRAQLSVPRGPMAGDHEAIWSAVLVRQDGRRLITSYHNTMRKADS